MLLIMANFQRKKIKSAAKTQQTAAIDTAMKDPLLVEVVEEKMIRKTRTAIERMAMRRTRTNHILCSSRLSRN